MAKKEKHSKHNTEMEEESVYGVTYYDCWGMHERLARIIANELRGFLYWQKHKGMGVPGIIYENCPTAETAEQEWLRVLRKMIYAFEEYQHKAPLEEREEEETPITNEERDAKIKEGMQLFIDYFDYLWI